MLGDFDFAVYYESATTFKLITIGMLVAYVIVVTILLLNLLIAMMGSTYNKVRQPVAAATEGAASNTTTAIVSRWIDRLQAGRQVAVADADVLFDSRLLCCVCVSTRRSTRPPRCSGTWSVRASCLPSSTRWARKSEEQKRTSIGQQRSSSNTQPHNTL